MEKALVGKDGLPAGDGRAAWYIFEQKQYEKENQAAKDGIILDPNTAKKYFKCPLCQVTKTNKAILPSALMGSYQPGPIKVKFIICCMECKEIYEKASAGTPTPEPTQ